MCDAVACEAIGSLPFRREYRRPFARGSGSYDTANEALKRREKGMVSNEIARSVKNLLGES
jgi:hypothetical protein